VTAFGTEFFKNRVAGMASSYKKPHIAMQLAIVRAGHAREKHQSDPNAVTLFVFPIEVVLC